MSVDEATDATADEPADGVDPLGAVSVVRAIRPDEVGAPKPIYVVWEITMKCDQPCAHCGSRAGRARPSELGYDEACEVIDALTRLGTREVVLIGGEAYLRKDCEDIIRRLAGRGIVVAMQTGGRAFTHERARCFKDAGLSAVGVSIDGPAAIHDKLRGNLGSHQATMRALDAGREAGLAITANSQINKLNLHCLESMAETLYQKGVRAWQVQLTGPLGRAADRPEWIIDPPDIVSIVDTLASIQLAMMQRWRDAPEGETPFAIMPSNNIGYFGPNELALRSRPFGRERHFGGCKAGMYTLGIESDGTVKGCPTLPTEAYGAGNVRTMTLDELWRRQAIGFGRDRSDDGLWGFCATCYYKSTCKGGCTWMTHTTLGKPGNNPYCYHRVVQLRKRGIRERLERVEKAPGAPYDHGRFRIVEESLRDEPGT